MLHQGQAPRHASIFIPLVDCHPHHEYVNQSVPDQEMHSRWRSKVTQYISHSVLVQLLFSLDNLYLTHIPYPSCGLSYLMQQRPSVHTQPKPKPKPSRGNIAVGKII